MSACADAVGRRLACVSHIVSGIAAVMRCAVLRMDCTGPHVRRASGGCGARRDPGSGADGGAGEWMDSAGAGWVGRCDRRHVGEVEPRRSGRRRTGGVVVMMQVAAAVVVVRVIGGRMVGEALLKRKTRMRNMRV